MITLFAVAHARTALYEEDAADPRRAPVYQAVAPLVEIASDFLAKRDAEEEAYYDPGPPVYVAPLVEIASDFLAKRDAEESERAFADPRAPLVEIASDFLAKRSISFKNLPKRHLTDFSFDFQIGRSIWSHCRCFTQS